MKNTVIAQIRGGLIVSCQALPEEPLHGAMFMARMAVSAYQGGAVGIRANTPQDIQAIRQAVPLPIIGLYKDGKEGVYITPTFYHARAIAESGADVIALDATARPRPNGETLATIIGAIHGQLEKLVLADVSTLEEAHTALALGADFVAPTLAGYTPYSPQTENPIALLSQFVEAFGQERVIAEGGFSTPALARQAIETGALAVVVGSAITRPQWITARFSEAIQHATPQNTHEESY